MTRVAVFWLLLLSEPAAAAFVQPCSALIESRLSAEEGRCEQSTFSSQDFRGGKDVSQYTVNKNAFFGYDTWHYEGEAWGRTSGKSGTIQLPSEPLTEYLLIFKGPNAHRIVGILLDRDWLNEYTTLSWLSPFLKTGKKPNYQDVSHVSLYARYYTPEPEPEWPTDVPTPMIPTLTVAALAFAGAYRRRAKRRQVATPAIGSPTP